MREGGGTHLLVGVSRNPHVDVQIALSCNLSQECLIVGDDDELEVAALSSILDDHGERLSERGDILLVEVGRRLVESDDAAVRAKRVRKSKSDDDGSQNLLTSTTSTSHVHFDLILDHDNLQE